MLNQTRKNVTQCIKNITIITNVRLVCEYAAINQEAPEMVRKKEKIEKNVNSRQIPILLHSTFNALAFFILIIIGLIKATNDKR